MKRLEADATRHGTPLNEAHQAATQRLSAARGEAHALAGAVLKKSDLRAALGTFEVWDALIPAERRRVVHLLLKGVAYHGARGELAMTYRPGGVLALAAEGAASWAPSGSASLRLQVPKCTTPDTITQLS